MSSFAKDLACCPRPYSPPVIRLCESVGQRSNRYSLADRHSAFGPSYEHTRSRIRSVQPRVPQDVPFRVHQFDLVHVIRLPFVPLCEFCVYGLVPWDLVDHEVHVGRDRRTDISRREVR